MGHAEGRRLDGLSLAVERLASLPLFREPTRLFDAEALALDDLSDRLGRALPAALTEDRHRLGLIGEALGRMLPGCSRRPARQWARPRVGSAIWASTSASVRDSVSRGLAADLSAPARR